MMRAVRYAFLAPLVLAAALVAVSLGYAVAEYEEGYFHE